MDRDDSRNWRASIQEGIDLEVLRFPGHACDSSLLDFMEGVNFNSTSKERLSRLKMLYLCSSRKEKFICALHSQPGIKINGPAAVTAMRGENGAEALQHLLAYPAFDINQCDENGCTALHKVVLDCWRGGHELVFRLLLQHQELQVNAVHRTFGTALSIACCFNRRELVQLLLDDPRIDINAAKANGRKPLVCAVQGSVTHHSGIALDLLLTHATKRGIRFTNDDLMNGWQLATNNKLPDIAARIAKHDKWRIRCPFELLRFVLLFDANVLLCRWLLWPPLKAFVLQHVFGSSS